MTHLDGRDPGTSDPVDVLFFVLHSIIYSIIHLARPVLVVTRENFPDEPQARQARLEKQRVHEAREHMRDLKILDGSREESAVKALPGCGAPNLQQISHFAANLQECN